MINFWEARAGRVRLLMQVIPDMLVALDFVNVVKQLGIIISLIMLWQKEYRLFKNLPYKDHGHNY